MINIIAVGKVSSKYFSDATEEYLKRLSPYTKIKITEIPESKLSGESPSEITKVISEEGKAISDKIKGFAVALDSRGEEMTSEELARLIDTKRTQGNPDITFIIGGSYGLSDEVLKKADLKLSFGRMTFPHQLMRVILTEQIYRAFTILNNSKYHK